MNGNALAALVLAAVSIHVTHLAVEPWSGKNLATTTSAAVKYRLSVTGAPNATLRLRASDLAKGWLAAFCTPTFCAPMQVDATLPASGRMVYQFELIREDESARAVSGARITSDDGSSVNVPPAPPR